MKKYVIVLCSLFLLSQTAYSQVSESIEVEQLTKSSVSWNGSELPAYPDGTPEISILKISIPAGVQMAMHRHPVINAGVLLSGELTVKTDEDESLHLKAGDPIVELVNKWHYGLNEGDEPAVIIVFYAGTEGTPLSISHEATSE